jgi:hypothetical protein
MIDWLICEYAITPSRRQFGPNRFAKEMLIVMRGRLVNLARPMSEIEWIL